MITTEKRFKNTQLCIASLYLLTILVLGGIYIRYETKPLPTSYQYENALAEATQAPHIAKLTISPTISYGGSGGNSLRKITHTIHLLSESKTNEGLVIDLVPCDKATKDNTVKSLEVGGFVNYTILKDALQSYKNNTNRKVIVHVTERLAVPFLFILAVADKIILDTEAIEKNTDKYVLGQINTYTCPEGIANSHPQQQKNKDNSIPHAGKYKLSPDPKETQQIFNALKKSMQNAITPLKKIHTHTRKNSMFNRAGTYHSLEQLCTCLKDYSSSGKTHGQVEEYIQGQITQVPIIDLRPCIDQSTTEYTPQERNNHRRTEACFETIMISADIDTTLVKKITPLIQSVHCDPNIKGVIIVWDSPGGMISSARKLLHLLKKLNTAKPIIHIATFQCTSAAYLLAAGTGEQLIAYPNAQLGSIGVTIEQKPNSSINLEKTKEELKKSRQWMIEAIAHNRAERLGINAEVYHQKLYDTEARTYTATRALEEQLIDRIGTLQDDGIDALKEQTGLDLPVYYSDNETK